MSREIDAATVGGTGEYLFRMIHPNSVGAACCHVIKAYQGGVPLGDAFYALTGLPDDLR